MNKILITILLITFSITAQANTKAGDWHYHESIDAMTDEDNSLAMTFNDIGGSLSVKCIGGEKYIIASPGKWLASDKPLRTSWRIDGGEVATQVRPATETLVIMPNDISDELAGGQQIIIRFSDHRGRQYTHTLSLVGYYDATGLLSCVK